MSFVRACLLRLSAGLGADPLLGSAHVDSGVQTPPQSVFLSKPALQILRPDRGVAPPTAPSLPGLSLWLPCIGVLWGNSTALASREVAYRCS